jgi:conjugative transfer signal peptidase TraF
MKPRRRHVRLAVLLVLPVLLLGVALLAGFRFNHTHSFPVGVYWMVPKAPAVGDLVLFEPPRAPSFDLALQRGYVRSGGGWRPYEPMVKRLVAVGGDVVSIDDAGVYVNGVRLTNSTPLPVDEAGRPMPVVRLRDYRLSSDEVLLMSDYSPVSFDARYFGPISRTQIQSVVRPVWTW